MTSRWSLWKTVFFASVFILTVFSSGADAQNPSPEQPASQEPAAEKSAARDLWSVLKRGIISLDVRYRLEAFERDGAPFTAPAYAPTLRLALGYTTPEFHGFSAFAQGEAVTVTGPADYSDPTLPSQNRPNLPAILDPKTLELSQAYVRWEHTLDHRNVALTVGRQELTLNDRRFLGSSAWRQVHGSFDAVKLDAELSQNLSFTYIFINRFLREVGYDATDGHPPMHTHVYDLAWTKPDRMRASLYGLLLDYRAAPQFSLSTQTYGLRVDGPFQFNQDWGLIYTGEFAKQKNFGSNPHHEDENYFLGEIGPGWRGYTFKASYAFLGGRSSTDLLTTPLAPPLNGWTDLFFTDPTIPAGNGLEAAFLTASGPIHFLGNTFGTVIFYHYDSDRPHVHYGDELDSSMAYRFKKFQNRWEIGWRFGRYWADRLYSNSVRTSVYTSFTL